MVETAHVVEVLKGFGRTYGVPEDAFGPTGECSIGIDEVHLDIVYLEERALLVVECELAPLPPRSEFAKLLDLNTAMGRSGGGQVGIDREAGTLLYFDHLDAEHLSIKSLEAFLQATAAGVETWRRWLSSSQAAPSDREPAHDAGSTLFFRL